MEIENHLNFLNIHNCLKIVFTLLIIIQFNLFGKIGLIGYGFMLAYSAVCIIYNAKKKHFCKSITFYSGILFYFFSLLGPMVNGGFNLIGTRILQLFFIMILAFFDRTENELLNDIKSLAKIMTIAGLVMGLSSILLTAFVSWQQEYIRQLPQNIASKLFYLAGSFSNRITGLAANANLTACYTMVGAICSAYLLTIATTPKWKYFSIANIFLSLYIIFIATASRTTMLAILGSAITYSSLYFFIICKGNKNKRIHFRKLLSIVLSVSLIIIMTLFIVPGLKNFVLTKIIRIDSLSTGSNRLQCYKSAWEMGHGNRLLGFSIADFTQQTGFLHTHNVFLEVLSFSGLLGFIPFIIYLTSSVFNIIKNIKICSLDIISNESKCTRCFIATIFMAFIIWGTTENGAIYSLVALAFLTQLAFGVSNTLAHQKHFNIKTKN